MPCIPSQPQECHVFEFAPESGVLSHDVGKQMEHNEAKKPSQSQFGDIVVRVHASDIIDEPCS